MQPWTAAVCSRCACRGLSHVCAAGGPRSFHPRHTQWSWSFQAMLSSSFPPSITFLFFSIFSCLIPTPRCYCLNFKWNDLQVTVLPPLSYSRTARDRFWPRRAERVLSAVLHECELSLLSPTLCRPERPSCGARLCPRRSARHSGGGCDGGSRCAQRVSDGYARE